MVQHMLTNTNKGHATLSVLQFLLITGAVLIRLGSPEVCVGTDGNNFSRLSNYIRPMVGTKGEERNTYRGPSAPFGMVQISPDTDTTNWETDSGYAYADPT